MTALTSEGENVSETKYIPTMKGFKATNAQMQCTPNDKVFQFELGVWYEHEGEIKECESGFHFCPQPSGVWDYYSTEGTRVFEIEAQEVLDKPFEPGAGVKRVARRIKFLREIEIGDDSNTGYRNTGDGNTGYRNTGDSNTGDGNATNRSSGFFCVQEPKVISFDKQTKLTRDEFTEQFPEYEQLCEALHDDAEIDFDTYKRIPGITCKKLKALHAAHLAAKTKNSDNDQR